MMILYTFKCEHGQTCNFFSDCKFCAKKKIDELQAENEQLRKDAERYRFLRDKANANKGNPFISILNNGVFSQWDGDGADEAIDSAMAETK